MQFKDKVVLITGGTAGIGRETALAFARAGAKVVVSGRREQEGAEVIKAIKAAGGEAIFVKADVTSEAEVKSLVDTTVTTFGRLDVAFNNAGVEQPITPTSEQTEELYHKVIDTNVKGVWLAQKYEIPAMLKNGGGAIVNTTSVAGLIGMAGVGIYVAAKHAVQGLTKSVALEYAKQGIRVNAVAPAAIETRMFTNFASTPEIAQTLASYHPIGRIGQPNEVADAVLWLSSDQASFVTGTTLAVDGGWTAQ